MGHQLQLSKQIPRTNEDWRTITLVACSVPENIPGTMRGMQCLATHNHCFLYQSNSSSVRTRIREGDGNFTVTAQSWPNFCYAHCTCDINDVEKGLFRGSLLVKVALYLDFNCAVVMTSFRQAFKFIFTSPSSIAEDNPNGTDGPPPGKRSKKDRTSTRSKVASLIGLRTVTPRSIAYTAVQVRILIKSRLLMVPTYCTLAVICSFWCNSLAYQRHRLQLCRLLLRHRRLLRDHAWAPCSNPCK